MLDIQGLSLSVQEANQLANPLIGGVILFSRNFADGAQLKLLVEDIRRAANRDILLAVDHEGGRVQRFRDDFTHLPAMGKIIEHTQGNVEQARPICYELGWLLASELLAYDIDISFAPVLDLDICSNVIGDRGFSSEPGITKELASAFIDGMAQAGMACTGKHFPGHGSVVADSHIDMPVDHREQVAIKELDRSVFEHLIRAHKLDALMPAHVIYPAFCDKPAGFSPFWLQSVLRQELGFDGVIFSDDLGMEGASVAGDFIGRAQAALTAGCDMILICNNPQAATLVLEHLTEVAKVERNKVISEASQKRLHRMRGTAIDNARLRASPRWLAASELAEKVKG